MGRAKKGGGGFGDGVVGVESGGWKSWGCCGLRIMIPLCFVSVVFCLCCEA